MASWYFFPKRDDFESLQSVKTHPMNLLKDLDLRITYRSDMGSIVDLFYNPCLERSILYRRAVGYFTSGGLAIAARGLSSFIRGSGKMMLVASPYMNEDDCRAISQGYEARNDVITRALIRFFDSDMDTLVRNRLSCLAWLIANERLEIKIAVRKPQAGTPFRGGLYHEKIGIFEDSRGHKVAFSGSSNETVGGLVDNFETLDIFWSWDDPQGRVVSKEQQFNDLWNDRTPSLEVLSFPRAAYEQLLKFKEEFPPLFDPESVPPSPAVVPLKERQRSFGVPESITLRDYQKSAIEEWVKNDFRGIFEMATGTGKTVTALSSAVELFKREQTLGIIILAPYIHLIDQWEDIVLEFGLFPVKCYESTSSWREKLKDQVTDLNTGGRRIICVIVTHTTACQLTFTEIVSRIKGSLLLIADEAHHLGASIFSKGLIPNAQFRLGLSATPGRWLDPAGNQILTDYFRKVVFSFPLQDAIARGFLCHYEYHAHIVPLDADEMGRYEDISLQISRIWVQASKDERAQTKLDFLLRERANILNCARGKIPLLKVLLPEPSEMTHVLFYCTHGQIDDVIHLLADTLSMRVRRFTAEESRQERQGLLSNFENGEIQGLVAMKCLDEGVDLPATKTAYILASSSNPREFIQRRGRILRLHPNKRRAVIHDLIAVPPISEGQTLFKECERVLLRRELARFKEFASAADNEYEATAQILEVASRFHVLDF
ncbi:DEAD/DEAH box helicase family protein [Candidatus Manganitrophus noduliformans]|uniref:DEAD/DEAH box helicase n=1 Tax=Candidatus Manganitrophus noduliformans TaxID=2606439 RepID=A0A7X6DNG0_9BACT|nr:DEAD/DEAH box helicase family protein [Candidatus Manganitrophus noduliformans]NKE70128.1 DEAD/DEAH box helicase [Candidatus Manganitrophus noduliformans]